MFSMKAEHTQSLSTFRIRVEIEEEPTLDLRSLIEDGLNPTTSVLETELEAPLLDEGDDVAGTVNCDVDEHDDTCAFEELTELREISCRLCPRLFVNRFNVLKHNLEHLQVQLTTPPMYQCSICKAIFIQQSQLTRHATNKHRDHFFKSKHDKFSRRLRPCALCRQEFELRQLSEHMRTVHSAVGPDVVWRCCLCLKRFKCEKYLMQHHLYVHEDNKPGWMIRKQQSKFNSLKCPDCPKILKSEDALRRHAISTHSDKELGFQCSICRLSLKSEANLNTHMENIHYDGQSDPFKLCPSSLESTQYIASPFEEYTHERSIQCQK